jgi:hypothetical protein
MQDTKSPELRQAGFSAILVIIALVVAAAIAGVGFLVFKGSTIPSILRPQPQHLLQRQPKKRESGDKNR